MSLLDRLAGFRCRDRTTCCCGGWAGLHLRRDGRGHRRVPPPVGVGAVIAGILGDRIGRRSVMLYALIFYCVFTLVAAAAPDYPVFVGARVLAGLGTGAESAIIAPFLAEFVPPARRGWFLGALAGFFSFGFVGAA
jgi:MFS transporter, putative metabolite:H+ symporter